MRITISRQADERPVEHPDGLADARGARDDDALPHTSRMSLRTQSGLPSGFRPPVIHRLPGMSNSWMPAPTSLPSGVAVLSACQRSKMGSPAAISARRISDDGTRRGQRSPTLGSSVFSFLSGCSAWANPVALSQKWRRQCSGTRQDKRLISADHRQGRRLQRQVPGRAGAQLRWKSAAMRAAENARQGAHTSHDERRLLGGVQWRKLGDRRARFVAGLASNCCPHSHSHRHAAAPMAASFLAER
jgi:hypothetical protein